VKRFSCLFLSLILLLGVLQAAPGLSPTVAEIRSSDNDCSIFTWHQPETEDDQEIMGYYVYWGADENGVSTYFQNNNFRDDTAQSFDPPPVQGFGEYYLRVRAVDKTGHSGGWATVLTYIYADEAEILAELTEDEYEEEYEEEYYDDEETGEDYFAETVDAEEIEMTAAEIEAETPEFIEDAGGELLAEAPQMSGGEFVISKASFTLDGDDNPFVRPIMLPAVILTEDGAHYQDVETEEAPQVAMRPIQLPTAMLRTDAVDTETEYAEEADAEIETEAVETEIAAVAANAEQTNAALFDPELPLTRKEMFRMIVRLLEEQGLPLPEKSVPQFSDVRAEQLAETEKAARYGLLRGFPDGTARLDQPVRKAEAACIFARYNAALGESLGSAFLNAPAFVDVPRTHWAYQEIAQTLAFFLPAAENYFQPQATLSRLDTARMLAKFKYVQDQRDNLPPLTERPAPSANPAENAHVSRLPGKEQ
jgi:hypothetical protein